MRILLCLLTMLPALAHAVIVQQEMRPGIPANAEYAAGERDKPAVLLLHGFLQTRDFHTVATLAGGLHDAGYTVLTPTLSLNIPNRAQSLACEAAHRHSLDDDVAEIGRWVRWLGKQGHRSVVLAGHSFGSLQLLAYLSGKPDAVVKAFLGISTIEPQIGNAVRADLIAQLETRVARKERALVSQALSFCRKYPSPPEGLLSYIRWDAARLLATLRQSRVPVQLVMGDADSHVERGWLLALAHTEVPLAIVVGANHFMDGGHEFDLLEHTIKFLEHSREGRRR